MRKIFNWLKNFFGFGKSNNDSYSVYNEMMEHIRTFDWSVYEED